MPSNVLPFRKPPQAPVSYTLAATSMWVALPLFSYWMCWRIAELTIRAAFGR